MKTKETPRVSMEGAAALDAVTRWRLTLGRYASNHLDMADSERARRMEAALDFLYSREYQGRGARDVDGGPNGMGGGQGEKGASGGLDPTQLTVPEWIARTRELFPQETVEIITRHALERYHLDELVTDPELLEKIEPSLDLLKTILCFRGMMEGEALTAARRVVRIVVEDLKRKLKPQIQRALAGRLSRLRSSPLKNPKAFDWRGTIRRNLRHYDPGLKKIIPQALRFFEVNTRRMPWRIILCVDQSGSMAGSVIHSAVMAGILAALPFVRVNLVAFDTSVVDLSDHVDDAVEILMNVQLGGGTNIAQALNYCQSLVNDPRRTALILVSDFEEGGSPKELLTACHRLREAGVRLLGLAALDEKANASFDRDMAASLADHGMEIAALTPARLAGWLAPILSGK